MVNNQSTPESDDFACLEALALNVGLSVLSDTLSLSASLRAQQTSIEFTPVAL